jgi:hypothetical protein
MVFRNRLDGIALVPMGGSAATCPLSLMAVTTTDGGVTWHSAATVRAQDAPVAIALSGGEPFLLNASCVGPYALVQAPSSAKAWTVLGHLPSDSQLFTFASAVSLTPSGSFATVVYSGIDQPLIKGYVHRGLGVGLSTWRAVSIASTGLPGHVVAVSFANAKDGLVATQAATLIGPTGVTLWATQNGGVTWSKALTRAGDDQPMLDLVNGRVAYAGVTQIARGGTSSLLYKSLDGGLRWAPLTLP